MTKPTDVSTFIADCDGGVFDNQISKILSEAAMSAVTHGRQADVTIKISMKQIDKSQQVSVKHKLSYLCGRSNSVYSRFHSGAVPNECFGQKENAGDRDMSQTWICTCPRHGMVVRETKREQPKSCQLRERGRTCGRKYESVKPAGNREVA